MARLIFLHIPRTAGNSVMRTMLKDKRVRHFQHDLRDPKFQFYGEVALPSDQVFTFVRHPVDRLLSAYWYLRNGGNHSPDAEDSYRLGLKNLSFSDFIKYKLTDAARWQIHFIPQTRWMDGIENLDVYRFEQLSAEFIRLCKKYQLSYQKLPKENYATRSVHYQQQLNAEELQLIKTVYQADYDQFSYE
ncbi:MAG: sulfotransferase family 2 domain-containing protein [Saprospiraceae bacterium]